MKYSIVAIVALAGVTFATPVPSENEEVAARSIVKRANPSVSGLKFNIDGVTKYFAGTNAYWMATQLTNNADVDLVMSHLQTAGIKVLRVWGEKCTPKCFRVGAKSRPGFNDITSSSATSGIWFQSFISGQTPMINTGTNGLQRLDYVVSSAAAHDIKLIINFTNNWSDFGGMPAYQTYYGVTAEAWYTDATVQAQYKAYVKAVVSRYTTSTAIFAWELANEPRCHGCPTSVVTTWATTISAYIKSLDSTHMVTLGDEVRLFSAK